MLAFTIFLSAMQINFLILISSLTEEIGMCSSWVLKELDTQKVICQTYSREMKPARWFSIDRKMLEIRLVTDNRPYILQRYYN